MGWLFKGFLAVIGFILLATGLWFVSLLIFAYLLYSVRRRKGKVERALIVTRQAEEREWDATNRTMGSSKFEWHWRYVAGGCLLLVALIAMGEHGTYSPLVFGGLGLLCIFWTPLSMNGRFALSALSPVKESIVLRPRLIPFVWMAVAEVKFASQEATRALAVLRDNLIVTCAGSETPGAYLAIQVIAPNYHSAETKIGERLRRLATLLASRGAYILPLDGGEVVERFQQRLEPVKLELDDSVVATIGHSHYDVLAIKPKGSHVKSFGAYSRVTDGGADEIESLIAGGSKTETAVRGARASLPQPRQKLERPPLLWEVISSLQERIRFSDPDGYTTLLNNMHVSKNVPLSQKLNLVKGGTDGGKMKDTTLMVESLGGTPVELTRTQLRAIVKIYG